MRNQDRTHLRILSLTGAAVLLTGVLFVALFRLMVVEAANPNSLYVRSGLTYTKTVTAARGEIRDRYGRVLVGNAPTYSLVFNKYLWDTGKQNRTILRLINILNAADEEYADELPLSFAPYSFTDEADSSTRSHLVSFLKDRKWNASLSPAELAEKLYARYGLSEKEYSAEEMRVIAGVRYTMEVHSFSYAGVFTFAEDVSTETVALIKENAFTFRGVEATVSPTRIYETDYAAHVLGHMGAIYREEYEELREQGYAMDARIGKDGAEKAFESDLRGINGKLRVTLDSKGSVIDENYTTEPSPGGNVFLSIDLELQQTAEDALASRIEEIRTLAATSSRYPADIGGGAAVVMEVNTGKVLAMASYPTYDLALFHQIYNTLAQDEAKPILNRAIGASYPPASTFKMVPAVAGLEERIITGYTKVNCTGVYKFYKDYTPRCWIYGKSHRTHGALDVSGAIANSCNIFFFETGRLLGIEKLDAFAKNFGFGERTGIELPGEVRGYRSNPETKKTLAGEAWYPGDTLQTAIGQSYTMVTPLQLCAYIAALANGGILYQPTILEKVTDYSDSAVLRASEPTVHNKIPISEQTRALIVDGMLHVTEDGTAASAFKDVSFSVAGKTGSAQVPSGSDNAVFAAFAPVEKPEIAVVVIVEHGNSGNSIAPIAREIFERYFAMDSSVASAPAK